MDLVIVFVSGKHQQLAKRTDLLKFHNAPVQYPTLQTFVGELCTCMHMSLTKWCIVGFVNCSIRTC